LILVWDTAPMKDDLIVILIVIIASLFSGFFGFTIGYRVMQQEAVDSGMAQWTVDKRAHVEFEWIKQK
jgi:hypothetical protein